MFGNWTFDPEDDFVLPDGSDGPTGEFNNFQSVHENFAMKCKIMWSYLYSWWYIFPYRIVFLFKINEFLKDYDCKYNKNILLINSPLNNCFKIWNESTLKILIK